MTRSDLAQLRAGAVGVAGGTALWTLLATAMAGGAAN